MNPVVLVLSVVAGFGVVTLVVALVRAERKRGEAMAYATQALGFRYQAEEELERLRATADLPLFSRGRGQKVRNLARGRRDEAEVALFDYQYTVGGGKNSQTLRQTVALFPVRALPDFVLAPENVFHRIGGLFGYQDIDFPENPEFSKRYLLRGGDETAIRASFGSDRLAFFAGETGWTVESRGGHIGAYRSGKRCKPEELQAFLIDAERVRQALAGR